MELRSPASIDEAKRWLLASAPMIDTPANRARLAPDAIDRTLARGHRRPDLVWAATEGERVLGLVAARDFGSARLIDVLALPDDPGASAALIRRATEWALPSEEAEVSFGAPAKAPLEDPAVRSLLGQLEAAGWRLLVTRRHYELAASALTARATPDLRLERASSGDEERLVALLERVLPGSLDVRDQAAVAEHGLEVAAQRWARELLEADPIDCIRFASDDGHDLGLVSWLTVPSRSGFVLQVGVEAAARGRGIGRALVAAATAGLLAEGALTLIADTDDANAPMQRAFAAEGWRATETRVDLHLP
ncbi:GNAT family N-acetyltransferase [Agrococcus sp. 1P02AA]|uniref:GNAT family N-acetyltransferase n=1 Tax=Agrococcus sp. 1P02AA TaxID=3132259 RepID=UPI0039A4A2D6